MDKMKKCTCLQEFKTPSLGLDPSNPDQI